MSRPQGFPSEPRHVVAIIGGAVAGSEAAALCAERGIHAIVLEQNPRPFGKIEDGLPRWHEKLRDKEYGQIGENLTREGVTFVPATQLGRDITLEELIKDWGVNAVLLANGAWRDRPLLPGLEEHIGKGLVYQNSFVYWYNHYPDRGYDGPRYTVHDDAVVVGGGLASIDVVKIINLELYKAALATRGIKATTLELEHAGIPATLQKHGVTQAELGVKGVTLYYRREKTAMPLASPPDNATPAQLDKVGQVRAKVMDKVIEKYLVRFAPNHAPLAPIVEDGRMVGVRFQRTKTVDGKLVNVEGDTVDVRSKLIVSSIGSVPLSTPGLPMKGELIDFASWDTGLVRGFDNVFGLGNVLTGKGNIKESRKNAQEIGQQVIEAYLGVGGELSLDGAHAAARAQAEPAVKAVEAKPMLTSAQLGKIAERVAKLQARANYAGDYAEYIAKVTPEASEA
jgi:NADPH-dependent glutamate synthase beta subunit-like oxidoreductase